MVRADGLESLEKSGLFHWRKPSGSLPLPGIPVKPVRHEVERQKPELNGRKEDLDGQADSPIGLGNDEGERQEKRRKRDLSHPRVFPDPILQAHSVGFQIFGSFRSARHRGQSHTNRGGSFTD